MFPGTTVTKLSLSSPPKISPKSLPKPARNNSSILLAYPLLFIASFTFELLSIFFKPVELSLNT